MVYRQQVPIRLFSIASCLALLLTILSTATTQAADVAISDGASVLNINKIKTEASSLSRSIYIFTTPSFTSPYASTNTPPDWVKGPTAIAQYQEESEKTYRETQLPADFDAHTRDSLATSNTDIAIGIDVKDRYISIQSKDGVPLSDSEASQAVSDFKTNFSDNDYTGALIAALNDIRTTLNGHNLDGLWNALKCVGVVLLFVLIFMIGAIFKGSGSGSSSSREDYHYHHSSYHSDSSFSSGSSSSNDSGSGGSGGGAGGFF